MVYSTYVFIACCNKQDFIKENSCMFYFPFSAQTYVSYTYSYNFSKNGSRCNYFELKCETTLVHLSVIIINIIHNNKITLTVSWQFTYHMRVIIIYLYRGKSIIVRKFYGQKSKV